MRRSHAGGNATGVAVPFWSGPDGADRPFDRGVQDAARVVRELLEQVLGIPLSLGSIQNSWEEASEAVAEPCAELEGRLAHEPVINSDETGYRTSGEKRRLWALVAGIGAAVSLAANDGPIGVLKGSAELYVTDANAENPRRLGHLPCPHRPQVLHHRIWPTRSNRRPPSQNPRTVRGAAPMTSRNSGPKVWSGKSGNRGDTRPFRKGCDP
jgi:Transposase IS66 family